MTRIPAQLRDDNYWQGERYSTLALAALIDRLATSAPADDQPAVTEASRRLRLLAAAERAYLLADDAATLLGPDAADLGVAGDHALVLHMPMVPPDAIQGDLLDDLERIIDLEVGAAGDWVPLRAAVDSSHDS